MSIQASLEITISAQGIDFFDAIKDSATNNGLDYDESSRSIISCSSDTAQDASLGLIYKGLISKKITLVTTVSAIAGFLIQMQPTIQEVIKANASEGITVSCGDIKIEVKGENDIEKAIAALKELGCDPGNGKSIKADNVDSDQSN